MGVEAARARAAQRPTARDPTRCGSRPRDPRTSTRPTRPRSTPRCASTRDVAALDFGGAVRSGVGALRAALDGTGDRARRQRRPPRRPADERRRVAGGDGAAALLVGSDDRRPGHRRVPRRRHAPPRSSSTAGAPRATAARSAWEERFGETKYVPLGEQAWNAGARRPRSSPPTQVDRLDRHRPARPRGPQHRAAGSASTKATIVDDLAATVGNTGTAHAGAAAHERARDGRARPGDRARRARRRRRRAAVPHDRRARGVPAGAHGRDADRERRRRSPTASSSRGAACVTLEPPRRPEPDRISASVVGPHRGLEVRVRRLARPRDRRAAPAAGARLARRRRASTTWSRRRWPTSRARSRRSRSTASPTRRARRSCSRSSTSTAAAGCPVELTDVDADDARRSATGSR